MTKAIAFLLFSFVASAQQYVISTLAGGVPPVTPAAAAGVSIGDPPRVAVDPSGNTYFGGLHSLYKVDRSGTLFRIAGTGRAGQAVDGPALSAQLDYPVGIAADAAGNVYYSERGGGRLRRLSTAGVLSTVPVDNLVGPMGLRFDRAGNLYVADTAANLVRKVAPGGAVTTVAGKGSAGFDGDGGPASAASLNGPEGVALDAAGNLYIADTFNHRVRVVTPDGAIATFAGTGFPGFSGDDGKATSATMILPTDVAVDASGNVYIADLGNSRIRKVSNGVITTIAGNFGGLPPRDGLAATAVRLSGPTGIAVDGEGAVYLAEGSIGSGSGLDGGSFRIWRIAGGRISALAGDGYRSFSGDLGPAALAQFDTPAGIAYDTKGNLYIADSENHRIRKISRDGVVTTVAGNALPGFSGDGGPATSAELNRPTGVAVDVEGNLYIADSGNNRIRMVFSNGRIGTLAGNGNTALFGDGGNSVQAALNHPQGVAVGPDGVYVADTGNHRIRRIASAIIDTVADGLVTPTGVLVDDTLSVWAADPGNGTVKRFQKTGTLTVPLPGARGLAIDPSGNVFASGLDTVVRIGNDGSSAIIAGSGQCCYSGDGGPAAAARLNMPWGLAADASGNLVIADSGNNALRFAMATGSTFFVRSVANGASNLVGPIAAGEVVTIYGAGLGPGTIATAPLPDAPTELGGTRVLVNGTPAQLLYSSAGQVSAVIPSSVTGPSAEVVVQYANASTAPFPLSVALASPGIFTADSTGSGQARALNANGTSNGRGSPAVPGTPLTFFLTGDGGGRAEVAIGGAPAEIQNTSRPFPGVAQVTVTVPRDVIGQASLVVTVGGIPSQNGVTVVLQ